MRYNEGSLGNQAVAFAFILTHWIAKWVIEILKVHYNFWALLDKLLVSIVKGESAKSLKGFISYKQNWGKYWFMLYLISDEIDVTRLLSSTVLKTFLVLKK